MYINELGERLRELRTRQRPSLSQSKLANILQVSRETINHWENGIREIKASQVAALADLYHVSCDYILNGVSTDNIDIHRKTGLSETAIQTLEKMSNGNDYKFMDEANGIASIDVINYLLSNEIFLQNFIRQLSDYIYEKQREETKTEHRELIRQNDESDIALFRITKIIERMAEDAYQKFCEQMPTEPRPGTKRDKQKKLFEILDFIDKKD